MPVTSRTRSRITCAVVLPVALTAALFAAPAQAAPTVPDPKLTTALPKAAEGDGPAPEKVLSRKGDRLGRHNREILAEARTDGKKSVTTLIATKRGSVPQVVRGLDSLGATVGYRNDKLGYVRATVPVNAVERAAKLTGLLGVELNETVSRIDPRPAALAAARADVAAPGRNTPDDNPYLPTNEIGSVAFKTAHPTWDGRDVTIGILDSGVDLDHPSLATTSTGERKIVDWITATDPLVEGDASWRAMLTAVTGPSFTAYNRTWTAPAGDFRINRFSESATAGSEYGGDVNRDGDTTDTWGILYRASDRAIWVDVDQDGDFTDEELRRPYRQGHQVGHFGTDNPATAVRESVPFVVEYREDVDLTPAGLAGQSADFVNIGIVADAHGSHVAGIAAGHSLFGGAMDGAAPGAKIVSSRACLFAGGCTSVALLEGMIDLVVNRGVDVVNMSIGGLPALNDGNNPRALLYNRLIADYGVQLIFSAGNSGPGINTVGDPSVASDVISVAAGLSKATALANYGAVTSAPDQMFPFSSRGPREDGGMKPNVSAPGSAISTTPLWLPGSPVAETGYSLPPGYSMFNGTSMSAPQTTGGAALLLSASRASDIPVTAAQLRTALYSSAAFDPRVSATAQGLGEVRVTQAWALLQRDARLTPAVLAVSAPVCTALSGFLGTPGRGAGLYNRCADTAGGHKPGQAKTYNVTVTRRSGAAGARSHTLQWLGNDGTFTAPRTVSLVRDRPTTVRITAKPGVGAHSAILRMDDPRTFGTDGYLSTTVIAGAALASPTFASSSSGRVERFNTTSYFVTVPEGTQALKVNLSQVAAGSLTRFIAFHPYGVAVEDTASTNCYVASSGCDPRSRSYSDPTPGVWELAVESRRTTPTLQNPFTLTAQVLGVSIDPEVTTVASAAVGDPVPLSWRLTNRFAPVTVRPEGGPLGSARSARETVADGATDRFEVVVPAGASSLDVSIGSPSDPGADLDLTVLRDGEVVAQDADGDSEESVSIPDPPAGTYVVEVVGYEVPAGTTDYDYLDVFTTANLGVLEVPAAPLTLGAGGAATLTGSLTVRTAPAVGRSLAGQLVLLNPDDVMVGRATVLVQNVTGG